MIVEKLINSIFQSAIKGELLGNFKSENTNDLLRPFTIPKEWKWVQLKELGEFVRGTGIKRSDTVDKGIQCVRYGEIYTTYKYKFEKANSYVKEELANKCKEAHTNDLLFTLTGESEYEIAKTITYLGKEELVIGGDMAIFTNHNQNPLYLTYYMYSPFAINYKAQNCTGKMIIHTSISKIQEMYVPLPPIEEQNKIVEKINHILSKVDEIKPLEEKISILRTEFPNKMKNSILNSILSKYQENTIELGKISKINGGYAFKSINYTDFGVRVIRISDFDENGITEENEVRHKYDNALDLYKLYNNDIIMCMTGGTVGKNVILENIPNDYYTNQRVATIRVYDGYIPKFVYYCINAPFIQRMIQENKNSTNDNISMPLIKSFPIPKVSIEIQKKIIMEIESILPICDEIEQLVNE